MDNCGVGGYLCHADIFIYDPGGQARDQTVDLLDRKVLDDPLKRVGHTFESAPEKEIRVSADVARDLVDHQVEFIGIGYSSGVYFYTLIVNNGKEVFSETKKMILIK